MKNGTIGHLEHKQKAKDVECTLPLADASISVAIPQYRSIDTVVSKYGY